MIALSVLAVFLMLMAVLVNSPPLFYMATAVIVLLGVARVQALLAVRGLRFERSVPPSVRVGEPVTVHITVWSDQRIMRPLVSVEDAIPSHLVYKERTPSLPVAPSYDQPIRTRYAFRPMRRGRFGWSKLTVHGTDALGLTTMSKTYTTDPVELTVYPAPIPCPIELNPVAGWGTSDLETGRTKGAGLETRNLREYVPGDPMRSIHWKTTARTGRLVVKEFDAGSGICLLFLPQHTQGTNIGHLDSSTLEAMCGHALYFCGEYLKKGATVAFPSLEPMDSRYEHPEARLRTVRDLLTDLRDDSHESISQELFLLRNKIPSGATVALMLSVPDQDLPAVITTMPSLHFIALVYDAKEYSPTALRTAAEPAYMRALEAVGVRVELMPVVESLM